MKRMLIMVLSLSMILYSMCVCALAEGDLGVQVIGGPGLETEPMTLEDIQIGKLYTIDGYAKIKPVEFLIINYFAQFNKDADYYDADNSYREDNRVYYQEEALKGEWAYYFKQAVWKESGENADFAWIQLDVTNLQKKSVKFLSDATVKIVYADEYEFAGWIRQANMDYSKKVYRYNSSTTGGTFAVLDPANEEAIDMMYTGTLVFGATLPNSVVEDAKSPLQMVITLGGNEIIYNIRK